MAVFFDNIEQDIIDEIVEVRKRIHAHPELGNAEFGTADLIEDYLKSLGIKTKRLLGTAVVGTLDFEEMGKVVALRADIDALPITEATDASFSSTNPGVMHACGHDVHTASLLGAAKLLADLKGANPRALAGTVRFIFQPDEEGDGGARRIIEAGVMKGVDAVFGAHVTPDLPEGVIGIRYGKFYAASDMFDVVINGVSSHGAQPEKGVDALVSAAAACVELKRIPDEEADKCVVSTGMFKAGTVRNAIADKAEFSGIIRSLGAENRSKLRRKFEAIIDRACEEYGATSEINFKESYMGIVNTHEETLLAETAALTEFGPSKVSIIEEPYMTTEDFGYYIDECSGSFYHIGAGCSAPLHSPKFLPTDNALVSAMRMHAAVASAYLSK